MISPVWVTSYHDYFYNFIVKFLHAERILNNSLKSVIKGDFFILDMPSYQDQTWIRLWKENAPELRERVVGWRKQNAITRIDRPSRIDRARRLGYKAKTGIVVVRMRVGTGRYEKAKTKLVGRRPKHLRCSSN